MLLLTAPLAAQEIDAPEPRWPVVMAAPADTGADTTEQAQAEQSQASQSNSAPAFAPGALSAPIEQPSTAAEAKAPPEDHHRTFSWCAPSELVVDDGPSVPPMSTRRKFRVFWRQQYNPCRYVGAAFSAGISQAEDQFHEYGQGMEGYGKRVGADLADTNLATLFGRSLLPILLHDDPRYFRMGPKGTLKQRVLHAIISPEWTRRDNGTSRFNYSRVIGDFMATSVGNAYYPEGDRGAGPTIRRGFTMLGTASGTALFQEFWPDIKARLLKKHKPEPDK